MSWLRFPCLYIAHQPPPLVGPQLGGDTAGREDAGPAAQVPGCLPAPADSGLLGHPGRGLSAGPRSPPRTQRPAAPHNVPPDPHGQPPPRPSASPGVPAPLSPAWGKPRTWGLAGALWGSAAPSPAGARLPASPNAAPRAPHRAAGRCRSLGPGLGDAALSPSVTGAPAGKLQQLPEPQGRSQDTAWALQGLLLAAWGARRGPAMPTLPS